MCKRLVLQARSLSIAIVIAGCERPAPERVANDADELRLESVASLAEDAWTLDTHAIAAQVGTYATPAPGQAGAFNGGDLGWAFVHRDKIWVLFGDSWFLDPVNAASLPDDALAQISLTDFPDGASVDRFVREHPAPYGQPSWRAAGPTMPVVLRDGIGAGFAPIMPERNGQPVPSGVGQTPITGFSNGRDDAAEGVFAIFYSFEHVACEAGQCRDGRACDSALSTDAVARFNPPCVVGSTLTCLPSRGLCQDRGTSLYNPTSNVARTMSTVLRHDVGVTTPSDPVHFKTQAWETFRFSNSTSRTATDFDPERANGAGNDYRPAKGDDLPRSGVFLWGRPQFGGVGSDGRDAQLYLLWAPMPKLDAQMHFAWAPQYFTGVNDLGRAQFSDRELDAKPLDLDAAAAGDQPEEARDVIGQMAVTWLPSLRRFVMFYGGEGVAMFADPIFGEDTAKVRHDPLGSLFVRFAENPWGPWTAPRPFFAAGDRAVDAKPIEQYAPGGILAHDRCLDLDCARYDPAYRLDIGANDNGAMYGASIIDAWTTALDDHTTDLYWFLSTWNPYQVVLMKTTIDR